MPRKPMGSTKGMKTLAVYLPVEQIEFLDRAARAEQTSVSDIVRRAVKRFFFLPDDISDANSVPSISKSSY